MERGGQRGTERLLTLDPSLVGWEEEASAKSPISDASVRAGPHAPFLLSVYRCVPGLPPARSIVGAQQMMVQQTVVEQDRSEGKQPKEAEAGRAVPATPCLTETHPSRGSRGRGEWQCLCGLSAREESNADEDLGL